MTKISKSPERHTFQKEGYVNRQIEKDEPINEAYLGWFDQILEEHKNKFSDPASRENNLEYDLLTTDWILEKVRANEIYAQNLYAAMCNRDFQKLDVLPILKDQTWCASWRYAGGIIADMREQGDYVDWYCSGIGSETTGYGLTGAEGTGYVPESVVTEEIENDLKKLGWLVLDVDLDNY